MTRGTEPFDSAFAEALDRRARTRVAEVLREPATAEQIAESLRLVFKAGFYDALEASRATLEAYGDRPEYDDLRNVLVSVCAGACMLAGVEVPPWLRELRQAPAPDEP